MANTVAGGDRLCEAALSTCAPGQIRWWVWHRRVEVTRNPDGSLTRVPGGWAQEPGTYCLGSDDPGVPDYGRAISLVQTGFKDLPLPRAQVEVAPAPRTLVHVPTAFYAGGEQAFRRVVTPVPGISVTVTAKPVSWTWRWGDGTSATVDTPGVPRKPVVAHTYDRVGELQADVAVTWRGSFTIAGVAGTYDIAEPAVVTSGPVPVDVRQARSQLVAQ